MRIKSPVGEYDYRVTAVRLNRSGLELDGSLGTWETTMVLEPGDLRRAARYVAPAAVLAALLVTRSR
ncbi:MAG: hypothetical protein QOC55_1148 [Thermoleophilaceae bacterium]|jgi:hypothetical protein|nr:hypothetical protein [Thermoleophilaceae bacterium]